MTANTYRKGNILFYQGNRPTGVYFICRGRIKLFKESPSGRSQIVRIVDAPNLLGDRSFFADRLYACTGQAMEDSTICFLEKNHFWTIFGQDQEMLRLLLQRFARELGRAEEQMHCLTVCSVNARLAAILLRASQALGGKKFILKETRTELAQIVGTTPEGVSRALAEFRDKGFIEIEGSQGRLLDEPHLRQATCPHDLQDGIANFVLAENQVVP